MVAERLKKTLNFLGASNNVIARYAGVDASLVSRLKSGSRTVKMNSASISRIAGGIYLFCDDRNIVPAFCSLFGGDSSGSRAETERKFILWLYENSGEQLDSDLKIKVKSPFTNIGSRIDNLMRLTCTSNIRLARAINVDSSYISRIRSGLRTPKSNLKLVRNICDAMSQKIIEQNMISETADLIKVSPELISNVSDLSTALFDWLSDTGQDSFSPAAEILLGKIESFSPDIKSAETDITLLTGKISDDNSAIYRGVDGLRKAVTRFLWDAIEAGGRELMLYSDQDMNWMVGDEEFRYRWFALMTECIKRNTRIKIIHNIERDIGEMIAAITSWLPLYMHGTIEPYYCAKKTDERFSHTMFLCEERACISAWHVRGCEGGGFYDYYTDSERLHFFAEEFKSALKISKPLVKLYSAPSLPEAPLYPGNVSIVGEAFSLATMPDELLDKMMERAAITDVEKKLVLSRRDYEIKSFETALQNGGVHELVPIGTYNPLKGVPSGIAEGVFYTADELRAHVKNILRLMDETAGYRVYALPDYQFSDMRVAAEKERVIVSRIKAPQMSFVFTHPLMIDAFASYTSNLKNKCEQDKNAARKKLAELL